MLGRSNEGHETHLISPEYFLVLQVAKGKEKEVEARSAKRMAGLADKTVLLRGGTDKAYGWGQLRSDLEKSQEPRKPRGVGGQNIRDLGDRDKRPPG